MFGPVVDSISIAQTWVTILYLAYFLLTFLHYSLKLRQALRLGSDEFIIRTISPNGLVLLLSMCEAAIGGLSNISVSIFFITFFLGWGTQPAAALLGPALGPGSEGFARAGHGLLHRALAAPPPSSPPCGAEARRAGRCWVEGTNCFSASPQLAQSPFLFLLFRL